MPDQPDDEQGAVSGPSSSQWWWRTASVYQVYIRSFADGDGDGIGDLAGLRARLPYLAELGVDALWINPWYPSPQADAGYDVADYRDIDPAFGTLADADALIAEAPRGRAAGDPRHRAQPHLRPSTPGSARRSRPDPAARAGRYIFRAGRGADGEQPPNDWRSNFGGPAWTRVTGPTVPGRVVPAPVRPRAARPRLGQPRGPRASSRTCCGSGSTAASTASGSTSAHGLVKAGRAARRGRAADPATQRDEPHPHWDRDGVHEIYRALARRSATLRRRPGVFVAEAWAADPSGWRATSGPTSCTPPSTSTSCVPPWDARGRCAGRSTTRSTQRGRGRRAQPPGCCPTTTWSGTSPATPGRSPITWSRPTGTGCAGREARRPRARLRRARAAALLVLALPGAAYLYQGEELGLPEVEDLPDELRQDPIWTRPATPTAAATAAGCRCRGRATGRRSASARRAPPRPGCRSPRPGRGSPRPRRRTTPSSTLNLYRQALKLRRALLEEAASFTWIDSPPELLAFGRGDLECWLNTGNRPVPLPHGQVLLGSDPGTEGGLLRPDAAVWVVTT